MDKKEEEKKERLLAALDKGMVMIHLDARRPGVIVPQYLRAEAHLRLNLSYRFEPPDLSVGEWGLRSTLSFSGSRFTVAVPWSALFAITSYITREFWIYPDDMPRELIDATMVPEKVDTQDGVAALLSDAPTPVATDGAKPSRSHLREIICEKSDEPAGNTTSAPSSSPAPVPSAVPAMTSSDDEGPKDEPPKPQRGHLRIVK